MSSRRRLTGPERRARILTEAGELFAREGWAGTSVERIASAAGVSTPVVYDHFGSKRELYVALLGQYAARLVEATTRVPDGSLEAVLRANVAAFYAFVQEHPAAWRMLFREAPPDPEIAAAHDRIQVAATARLAETIVARAQPLALGMDVDPEQAAIMLAELGKSALNGLAAWWWSHPEVDRETVTAIAFDLLWRGVAGLAGRT